MKKNLIEYWLLIGMIFSVILCIVIFAISIANGFNVNPYFFLILLTECIPIFLVVLFANLIDNLRK
jgi:hypothetical protein